jgi:hypothetical protein
VPIPFGQTNSKSISEVFFFYFMKQILPNWGLGLEVIGAGYLKISFGTA